MDHRRVRPPKPVLINRMFGVPAQQRPRRGLVSPTYGYVEVEGRRSWVPAWAVRPADVTES